MQNSAINISIAATNDLEEAANLFDAYRQFYKQSADLAACKNYLNQRITQNEIIIFIAKYNGEYAGLSNVYPTFSSVSMAPLWTLNDLYVDNKFRRKGIAKKLIQHICQEAKSRSITGLQLETAKDNAAAQELYENAGWEINQYLSYNYKTGVQK